MKHKFTFFLASLGYIFLYLPILVLVIFSFNDSKLVSLWGGFSLRWYKEIWHDTELHLALYQSIKIAIISASIGTFIGVFTGLSLSRMQFFSKSFFSFFVPMPLLLPEIIIGLSLLILFQTIGIIFNIHIYQGSVTVIIAHSTLCMSYVATLIQLRLDELKSFKSIEEAAANLGATPIKVFIEITYPLLKPAIISSWILSFMLSFDDLVLATFTTGPGTTTLPMLIYSRVRLGLNPEINVLGTIIIILGLLGLIISAIVRKYQKYT